MESWCLASSRADLKPSEVVNPYGRRFTIEERFRDIKDWRFGMGVLRFRWSLLSDGTGCSLSSCLLAQTLLHIWGPQVRRWECRDSSKPTPSNPAFTLCIARAKPICNFSQPCPKASPKSLRRFLELLLQHAKTSKLLALL